MKKMFKKWVALLLAFVVCFSTITIVSEVDASAANTNVATILPYIYLNAAKEPVQMAGITYDDGILFRMGYTGVSNGYTGEVNYNFKGEYSLLTFYAGYSKGNQRNAGFTVYADGKEIINETLLYTGIAKLYQVELSGVNRLTIRFNSNGYDGTYYGIGGIKMYADNIIDEPVYKSRFTRKPYLLTNASEVNGKFNMGGYQYKDGYDMSMGYRGNSTTGKSEIIFNFEGKYNFMSFDFARYQEGKVRYDRNCYLKITADGKVLYELTVNWNDVPKTFDIDLTGVSQLSIYAESNGYDNVHYRLANILIDPTVYEIVDREFYNNLDYYAQNKSSLSYNPTLANMLAALSVAVYSREDITEACNNLDFDSYAVHDYEEKFNPHSCGYSLAFKEADYGDEIICLVSVRGSSNTSDWVGNFELATIEDDKHIGFAYPANRIYDEIQNYMAKSQNPKATVKYFITGHSRGAAVANLLSVKLMENGVDASNVYNYNFACPDVACKYIFPKYNNIFNLCNREDIVPYIPGSIASYFTSRGTSWGKFGQTYWFTKDAEDTINPFSDHDSKLYLEFFDQKLAPSDWGYSFADALDDSAHLVIGWITKVHCPVDVVITDKNGNKVASVIGGKINYYDSQIGNVLIFTDGEEKVIFTKGDKDFNINLIGTDTGKMTYSVEKVELKSGKVFESKTFENVALENGKTMYSPVSEAESAADIKLFVTEEQGEKTEYTYIVFENGTERKYNYVPDCDVSIKNNPGSKTIKYGETLRLTAAYNNKPEDAVVCWYVGGVMKGTGDTFDLTIESGTEAVEVKLTDSEGYALTNAAGDEIADFEEVSVNDGFFQKLISFFKNLFGIDRTVIQ